MSFLSAAAMRTTVFVVALSGAGLWALRAMDAKADPPLLEESQPCAEGRALFAAKLAYLEARVSPEPSQEEAWRTFANAMRATAGALDRACAEEPPRPQSVDAGQRLKRMESHAAAMQAMFGQMADAYLTIAPNLTAAQRDILSQNIVPSPPFPSPFSPPPGGPGPRPRAQDLALNCGPGGPGFHAWTPLWGAPPF
jgi:LTXXQ motif family protein